jgi:hypothetical protein
MVIMLSIAVSSERRGLNGIIETGEVFASLIAFNSCNF